MGLVGRKETAQNPEDRQDSHFAAVAGCKLVDRPVTCTVRSPLATGKVILEGIEPAKRCPVMDHAARSTEELA